MNKMRVRSLLTIFFLMVCVTLTAPRYSRRVHAIAQDNCAALTNELNALKSSRARLQDNLQRATGTDRQSFLQQIKELDAEIQEKQRQLNKCVVHYEVRPKIGR